MTWGWRKLQQIRPAIREFVWYKVGNGNTISALFDAWSQICPLMQYVTAREITRVGFHLSMSLSDVVTNHAWNYPSAWANRLANLDSWTKIWTKTFRSRQKSYADKRRKPLEFQVGDRVLLKVSPWKGVVRFGKKGKLAPRYVGPFEIVERVGPVPLDEIEIDENLRFVEEPIEIVERDVKKLKRRIIPLVKVRWNSRQGVEYTWEHEDQFRKKYPHLFYEPVPSLPSDSFVTHFSIVIYFVDYHSLEVKELIDATGYYVNIDSSDRTIQKKVCRGNPIVVIYLFDYRGASLESCYNGGRSHMKEEDEQALKALEQEAKVVEITVDGQDDEEEHSIKNN
ncbi:hypothetical protein Tco_1523576 [Tanacetum coccineum]